jgi:hypothetical protein
VISGGAFVLLLSSNATENGCPTNLKMVCYD